MQRKIIRSKSISLHEQEAEYKKVDAIINQAHRLAEKFVENTRRRNKEFIFQR